LKEAVVRRGDSKHIRILSLPCSTGEEAYSIAIYLLEYWPQVNDYNVEIVAGDIDTQVLNAARLGIYNSRSTRFVPEPLLRKYFTAVCDGQQICQELRDSIEFRQINLNEPAQICLYQSFDVIFCRNLLIYFDDLSRRQAAETFYDALRPGGFLCLGHSESMSRVSSLFEVRRFADAIVYQKTL
jgi:chemotaxis protein methyltransferase CheR